MRPASVLASFVLVAGQAIVLAGSMTPAMAAPAAVADAGQKGPFEIGFTSFMLTDASRPGDGLAYASRPIPVYVWYPVDAEAVAPSSPEAQVPLDPIYGGLPAYPASAWLPYGFDQALQEPPPSTQGPFPLVVFSPGWGAEPWFHMPVAARLASHGFVVAVMYHFGDQFWPWEPPLDHVAVAAFNRPRDMSFVLSDLLAKNVTPGHLLEGTIRADQVAAAGWSLGGYAAITTAGGDDSVCDMFYGMFPQDPPPWTCAPTLPDTRFEVIVPLDGSGQALHFWEMARVTVPVLGMGEEWSTLAALAEQGAPPGWEAWQARNHAAYSGHPAYRVDVLNSNHPSFGDVCDGFRFLVDQGIFPAAAMEPVFAANCDPYIPSALANRIITQYMVAFLKVELAGERGYSAMLTPGWALTSEPNAELFVTEKRSPQSIGADWPSDFVYFMHQPGSAQARAATEPAVRMPIPRVAAVP